jgi:cytochrome c
LRVLKAPQVGVALAALAVVALWAEPAHASQSLASDRGCYNCHGSPPRQKAPGFAQLAQRYAPARGDDKALRHLAEQLRSSSPLGHVEAHERLSAEEAARLVRWISEGAN